jgi:hypothetical protein
MSLPSVATLLPLLQVTPPWWARLAGVATLFVLGVVLNWPDGPQRTWNDVDGKPAWPIDTTAPVFSLDGTTFVTTPASSDGPRVEGGTVVPHDTFYARYTLDTDEQPIIAIHTNGQDDPVHPNASGASKASHTALHRLRCEMLRSHVGRAPWQSSVRARRSALSMTQSSVCAHRSHTTCDCVEDVCCHIKNQRRDIKDVRLHIEDARVSIQGCAGVESRMRDFTSRMHRRRIKDVRLHIEDAPTSNQGCATSY